MGHPLVAAWNVPDRHWGISEIIKVQCVLNGRDCGVTVAGSCLVKKLKSFLTNLGIARDVKDPIKSSEVGGTSPPVQRGPLGHLCRLVRCNLG